MVGFFVCVQEIGDTFKCDRAVLEYRTRVPFSFFARVFGDPTVAGKVEELGLRGKVFQPGDQSVQAVPAVLLFKHLDLVDDHCPDIPERVPQRIR